MRLSAGEFIFDAHLASLVEQIIGDSVLFYDVTVFEEVAFFAHAVLQEVDGSEGENRGLLARLADMYFFEGAATAQPGISEENDGFIWLSEGQFEAILEEDGRSRPSGFSTAEQQTLFDRDTPSTETYRAVYKLALERAEYTCAFTGQVFDSFAGVHPDLNVVAIRPLGAGGSLHTSNFLVLSKTATEAFDRGYLTVGDDHSIIADLSGLDPDLLEALNPLGRLVLSPNRDFWPDTDQLAYHRRHIFGGKLD